MAKETGLQNAHKNACLHIISTASIKLAGISRIGVNILYLSSLESEIRINSPLRSNTLCEKLMSLSNGAGGIAKYNVIMPIIVIDSSLILRDNLIYLIF